MEMKTTDDKPESIMDARDSIRVKEEPPDIHPTSSILPGNHGNTEEFITDDFPESIMDASDSIRVKEEPPEIHPTSSNLPENHGNVEEFITDDYPGTVASKKFATTKAKYVAEKKKYLESKSVKFPQCAFSGVMDSFSGDRGNNSVTTLSNLPDVPAGQAREGSSHVERWLHSPLTVSTGEPSTSSRVVEQLSPQSSAAATPSSATKKRKHSGDEIVDCIRDNMQSLNEWKQSQQKQDYVFHFAMMVAERLRLLSPMRCLRFITKVQKDLLDAELEDRQDLHEK